MEKPGGAHCNAAVAGAFQSAVSSASVTSAGQFPGLSFSELGLVKLHVAALEAVGVNTDPCGMSRPATPTKHPSCESESCARRKSLTGTVRHRPPCPVVLHVPLPPA